MNRQGSQRGKSTDPAAQGRVAPEPPDQAGQAGQAGQAAQAGQASQAGHADQAGIPPSLAKGATTKPQHNSVASSWLDDKDVKTLMKLDQLEGQ